MSLASGHIFEHRFQLLELYKEDELFSLWRGHDVVRDQPCLIRVLQADVTLHDVDQIVAFDRSRSAIKRLSADGVIRQRAAGWYEGMPYAVFEKTNGVLLQELFEQSFELDLNTIVNIIKSIALTLSESHKKGVIHQLIDPSSIIIDSENNEGKIFGFSMLPLLDFTAISDERSIEEHIVYMAPEVAGIVDNPIDERSDLYALGIIFYRMLTGIVPFKAKSMNELLHKQVTIKPAFPLDMPLLVPEDISGVVMKLLAKSPNMRYQTANSLLFDIERFLEGERGFLTINAKEDFVIAEQTRLVGREKELSQLHDYYSNTRKGRGSVCFISGDEGTGKHRLIEEFKIFCEETGALFITGMCVDKDADLYQGFREASEDFVNCLLAADESVLKSEKNRLRQLFADKGEILARLNSRLSEIIGSAPHLSPLDPETEKERFLLVVAHFFSVLGSVDRPCVLFLAGLHSIDEGSANLLEYIIREIAKTHLMVIGTYTSGFSDNFELYRLLKSSQNQHYPVKTIELKVFDRLRMNDFVNSLLGDNALSTDELSKFIFEKSGGNPFFGLSIMRLLASEKLLYAQNGVWDVDADRLKSFNIPDNVVDVLLRKIEDFDSSVQELLSTAALVGKKVDLSLLYSIIDIDRKKIEEYVSILTEHNLIVFSQNPARISFIHERVRMACLKMLKDQSRIELHLRIAFALEQKYNADLQYVITDLVHHFYEANETPKILEYSLLAADAAAADYDNDLAIKYYKMALSVLESVGHEFSAQWLSATEGLTQIYLRIGESDAAIALLEKVLPLKESIIDKAEIKNTIGRALFLKGDLRGCEIAFINALELLECKIPKRGVGKCLLNVLKEYSLKIKRSLFCFKSGNPHKLTNEKNRLVVLTHVSLCWVYLFTDIKSLRSFTVRALNLCISGFGGKKEYASNLALYAACLNFRGKRRLAKKEFDRCLALRNEFSDEAVYGQCLYLLGNFYISNAEYQKAISVFERARDKFSMTGNQWESALVMKGLGFAYLSLGDLQNSLKCFTEYYNVAVKISDKYSEIIAAACMIYIYSHIGNFNLADEWNKKSLALMDDGETSLPAFLVNLYSGYLELRRENIFNSLNYFDRAEVINAKNDFSVETVLPLRLYRTEAQIGLYTTKKLASSAAQQKNEMKKIAGQIIDLKKKSSVYIHYETEIFRVIAKYNLLLDKTTRAEYYFDASIRKAQELGRKFLLAEIYYDYGSYFNCVNKEVHARNFLGLAYDTFKSIGAEAYIHKCEVILQFDKAAKDDTPQQRLQKERRMAALFDTSRFLSSILDLDELLNLIMDKLMELVGAERGVLMLYPEDEAKMHVLDMKVMRNIEYKEFENEDFLKSYMLIKDVERTQKAVVISDIAELEPKVSQDIEDQNHWSVLCAPITARGKILGVVYLDNRLVSDLFSEDDMWVLEVMASQTGVSIDNARLFTMAAHDGITGLYNRGFFNNFLHQSVQESLRYNKNLSLVFIDLDLFKQINDVYGHQAGDTVLKKVASTIKTEIRKSDIPARYGGDEFVLLLPNTDSENAMVVCERISESVRKNDFVFRGEQGPEIVNVTVSIGVSELCDEMLEEDLLAAADKALYKVKQDGRGGVQAWIS